MDAGIRSVRTATGQRGAALIVALLLLVVLTIIGIGAMQTTRMEERMAGNTRDLNLAFQAAEAALRDGEARIRAANSRPETCSAAPCEVWQLGALPPLELQTRDWWDDPDITLEYGANGVDDIAELAADPHLVVEALGFVPDSLTVGHGVPEGRDFYRITAHSTGGSGEAESIVQSTFTRRF
jgi:type IV pilus assembly protein PilX